MKRGKKRSDPTAHPNPQGGGKGIKRNQKIKSVRKNYYMEGKMDERKNRKPALSMVCPSQSKGKGRGGGRT